MRVSQKSKGSDEDRRRPAGPERCSGCGESGGEIGLGRDGLCAECVQERRLAQRAVTSLIDHGVGVSRARLEAL